MPNQKRERASMEEPISQYTASDRNPKRRNAPLQHHPETQLKRMEAQQDKKLHKQLPSPPFTHPLKQRKFLVGHLNDSSAFEASHISGSVPGTELQEQTDPVECWILTGYWPAGLAGAAVTMSKLPPKKPNRKRPSSANNAEAKRQRAEHGVLMEESPRFPTESKEFCKKFLPNNHTYISCTGYPNEKYHSLLPLLCNFSETRIQRDLMPEVVLPVEILRLHDQPDLALIREELGATWEYCHTKGGKKPKPDYTAGLALVAFNLEEVRKLKAYSETEGPYLLTPSVCFPFLTCEAKSGLQALNRAQAQNINNGSIAVDRIIRLYRAAFGQSEPRRVEELYGKVLAFSVSHDYESVHIWGHYALMPDHASTSDHVVSDNALISEYALMPDQPQFFYHEIDSFRLKDNGGENRYRGYHFTRNVYQKFFPQHFERIKDAVKNLHGPTESDGNNTQRYPQSVPPSFGDSVMIATIKGMEEQISELLHESKEREEKLERQLEEQKKESKEREEKQEKESKEREEKLERQLEEQKKEMEQRHKEVMELLKSRT